MSVGAAHIISHLLTALRHLLKLGHNQIIAALPAPERTHPVVHFLASVNAEHDVCHFFVGKLQYLIVQQHTVGCQGEAEFLVVGLLQASAVLHQVLYHLPVHQRLSTKEIHLEVHPVAGIGNQKIKSLLSYLIGHKSSSSVILSFFCKAITTSQIAIVSYMKAKSFYHCLSLLELHYIIFIYIWSK